MALEADKHARGVACSPSLDRWIIELSGGRAHPNGNDVQEVATYFTLLTSDQVRYVETQQSDTTN
jgi:hypothetical protein